MDCCSLALRILPTSDAQCEGERTIGLLCKEQTVCKHDPAADSFLISKMTDSLDCQGSVCCLGASYRQRWTAALLSKMHRYVQVHAQKALVKTGIVVHIEIYHFSSVVDKDLLRSIGERGCESLRLLLGDSDYEVFIAWPDTAMTEIEIASKEIVLRPQLHQINESSENMPLPAKIALEHALKQASSHLLGFPPMRCKKPCRTIILADTALAARKQIQWARSQRILSPSSPTVQEPILGEDEEVLSLHLVDHVPSVKNILDISAGERDICDWDPWEEWLQEYVNTSIFPKHRAYKADIENSGLCVRSSTDVLDYVFLSVRRGERTIADAIRKFWDIATIKQRIQLAWLGVYRNGNTDDIPSSAKGIVDLGNFWVEHPDRDWIDKLRRCLLIEDPSREACENEIDKKNLRKKILVPIGHKNLRCGTPHELFRKEGSNRTDFFQQAEDFEIRKVDNALSMLNSLYVTSFVSDTFIPECHRAKTLALDYALKDGLELKQRWQFLWFAVVGTETSEEVAVFLQDLHDKAQGVENPEAMRLCILARFWSYSCRTPEYRRGGVNRRRDPVRLSDISDWLHNIPYSKWCAAATRDGKENRVFAARHWITALRAECRYMNSLERSSGQRGRAKSDVFGGTLWQLYSTRERDHDEGIHFSLEMLQRNLEIISQHILHCVQVGKLAPPNSCRLIVGGALSRRFWTLVYGASEFTVVQLGQKLAPQAGTNNKMESLSVSRRAVFQICSQDRERRRQEIRTAHATATSERLLKIHVMEKAIRYALLQVLDEVKGASQLHQEPQTEKDWWHRAALVSPHTTLSGIGVLLDGDWTREVVQPMAVILTDIDDCEERCRNKYPELRKRLEEIWLHRLSLTLRQAAVSACLGLSSPYTCFLETTMETLQKANEDPLLQMISKEPPLQDVCQGLYGNEVNRIAVKLKYSQPIKMFVQYALSTVAVGPSSSLAITRWLFQDAEVICQVNAAHSMQKACKLDQTLRVEDKTRYINNQLVRAWFHVTGGLQNYVYTEHEKKIMAEVAPYSHSRCSDFEHMRRVGFENVVLLRKRFLYANLFVEHFKRCPHPQGIFLLMEATMLPLEGFKCPKKEVRSQEHLLAALEDTETRIELELPRADFIGKYASLAHILLHRQRSRITSTSAELCTPIPSQISTGCDTFCERHVGQLELSGSIQYIRCFLEQHAQWQWRNLSSMRHSVQENLKMGPPHLVDAKQFYLLGMIIWRSAQSLELSLLLLDVIRYGTNFDAPPIDGKKLAYHGRTVLRDLVPHMHRNRVEKSADARLRRRQVESFSIKMRNLYRDRPRSKGVLDAFGHRIWGVSTDIKNWIAEGEQIRPSFEALRALRADPVAAAWYSSFKLGEKRNSRERQHDCERSDSELARDVLCDPANRGIQLDSIMYGESADGAPESANARVSHMRKNWKADTCRLGCMEKYPILQMCTHYQTYQYDVPRLGAHEIHQPVLRRLVAPDNVPDVAWLACQLREPIEIGDQEVPSHLALAQCPYTKRALEPLTHSLELWPLFAKHFCESDFADSASVLAAFAREGSPVPIASCVAANHHFIQLEKRRSRPRQDLLKKLEHDYREPCPELLGELKNAWKESAWPACLEPSPIWEEKDIRSSSRATTPGDEWPYQGSFTKLESIHRNRYRVSSEEEWFESERNAETFSVVARERSWYVHQRRHRKEPLPLCRPPDRLNRRNWILHHKLPMTPWCDTGVLPPILQLSSPRLDQPAVLCARTAGRRVLAGSLHYGPYTREEHRKYVGDIGACVLFGQRQQMLLRSLEQQGLVFIAINQDRQSMLREILTQASVLYLLGKWLHFPIFHGEGQSSFPWLGPRWHKGLQLVQKLVRRRLRDILNEPKTASIISRLRGEHPKKEDATLSDLAAVFPGQVPELALKVEEVQSNVIKLNQLQKQQKRGGCNSLIPTPARHDLESTLADTPTKSNSVLLSFPTQHHIRIRCSRPLEQGGFLAPRDLRKWMHLDMIAQQRWPELGDLAGGHNPRVSPPSQPLRVMRPWLSGEHILVLPNWAFYMRGLSEQLGRGPRDSSEAWECCYRDKSECPQRVAVTDRTHALYHVIETLRLLGPEAYLTARKIIALISRYSSESRRRWRGLASEEVLKLDPDPKECRIFPEPPPHVVIHSSKSIREWLESADCSQYLKVRPVFDLRNERDIQGATVCLSEARLSRARKRVAQGKTPKNGIIALGLEGALYLHGCRTPARGRTVSANYVRDFGGGQRTLDSECSSNRIELSEEKRKAKIRTQEELSQPRWPDGTHLCPGLHGAKACQAVSEDHLGFRIVLVVGRASACDQPYITNMCAAFPSAPVLALYPENPIHTTKKPHRISYELQAASLHLMQRQLGNLFRTDKLLVLAMGCEAQAIIADVNLILRDPEADAEPLILGNRDISGPERVFEVLPPRGAIEWNLPILSSFATLPQLLNATQAKKLYSECLGAEWKQVHSLVSRALHEKRKRNGEPSASKKRVRYAPSL